MRTARTAVSLLLSLCLPVAACGDDDEPNNPIDAGPGDDDDAGADDGGAPDAAFCAAPAAGAIGGTCPTLGPDPSCDSTAGAGDGNCLNADVDGERWPEEGFCMPIGEAVPVGDAVNCLACPDGSVCVRVEQGGFVFPACMPACCENGACSEGRVCADGIFGGALAAEACVPATANAEDGDACATFEDCALHSSCLSDPFLHPGGYCSRLNCTTLFGDGDNCAANGDGRCVAVEEDIAPRCVDTCVNNTDCRTADGYVCFDGTARGQGKFCRHPEVGDSCADTAACSGPPWNCRTAPGFPGGYCTIEACTPGNNATCPNGSVCFDPGGAPTPFCADLCNPNNIGTCRVGYECALVFDDTSPANNDQFACLPE